MTTFEAAFADAEKRALGFLVSEHGFHAVAPSSDWCAFPAGTVASVTYAQAPRPTVASDSAKFVELIAVPFRLELGLSISTDPQRSYPVEELHSLDGHGPFPPAAHGIYASRDDPARLLVEFTRLAGVLRDCGARFFSGDPKLWLDLEAQRQAQIHAQVQSDSDARAVSESESAFKSKDWPRVVALLSPIARRLTKSVGMRLAYAQAKLQDTT